MKPRHKYGARATACAEGHKHPSAKEAKRCAELHLLQRSGAISHLQVEPQFLFVINGEQVKHPNGRRVGWKPDFQYFDGDANVVEDVKGGPATKTEAYALRKALFRALFPFIEVREV